MAEVQSLEVLNFFANAHITNKSSTRVNTMVILMSSEERMSGMQSNSTKLLLNLLQVGIIIIVRLLTDTCN